MKRRVFFPLMALLAVIIASFSISKTEDKPVYSINTPDVNYVNIAGGWDNAHFDSSPGYSHTILRFDKNFADKANATNQATADYSIGNNLSINGVAIKDLPGSTVSYAHGNAFLYFAVKDIYLQPTLDYPTTVMHIAEGTEFMGKVLPEVYLHLVNKTSAGDLPAYGWKKVTFTGVNTYWNNVDANSFHGSDFAHNQYSIPSEGYCVLLDFSLTLSSSNRAIYTNMATAEYEIANNTFISGTKLADMPGALVDYCVAENHLFIYFPENAIDFRGNSQRITLKILAGTRFLDVFLPEVYLINTLPLGINGGWKTYQEDVKTEKVFTEITWNNICYPPYPEDAGLLLKFDSNLSNNPYENGTSFAGASTRNVVHTDIGNMIRFNNIPLSTIPGAVIRYFHVGYIFIYAPGMKSIPQGLDKSTITIEAGAEFYDSIFPYLSFRLNRLTLKWETCNDYYSTYGKPSIKSIDNVNYDGLCYTSVIEYSYYLGLKKQNATFGTYIIDENSFKNSGYATINDYVNNVEPSSRTYIDVINVNSDFTNELSAVVDGYVSFNGSLVNIKPSNYARKFIASGYYKINNVITTFVNSAEGYDYFSIAFEEIRNGTFPNPERLLNKVAIFNETNVNMQLVPDTSFELSYNFTYVGNGYYELSAGTNIEFIIINGQALQVSIPAGTSKIFSYYNGKLHYANNTNTLNGIGEPTRELFDDNGANTSPYSYLDNISDLAGAFNCKTQRIWVDSAKALIANSISGSKYASLINYDNTIVLADDFKANLHNAISSYRSNGVEEIIIMVSGFAYKWTDPIYLNNDGTYGSNSVHRESGISYAPVVPDRNMNNPSVADNAIYESFLATQSDFFYELAKEFDDADVFESYNEYDLGGYIYSMEYRSFGTIPSISYMSKVAMDLSKAMNDGVRRAKNGHRVLSPAFACVDQTTNLKYNTKAFITSCYEYISGKGDLPKNYFQSLNIHPYVFPSKTNCGADANYLYNSKPSYLNSYRPDVSNYDVKWNTYIEDIRSIMSVHSDGTFTPFYITEFGLCDYGVDGKNSSNKTTDSSWNKISSTLSADVINKIYAVIKTKNYFHSVVFFRMLDYTPTGTDVTRCTEPNFGMIDELYNNTMYLKNIGKAVYALNNNGSTNYTDVLNAINRVIARGTYNA